MLGYEKRDVTGLALVAAVLMAWGVTGCSDSKKTDEGTGTGKTELPPATEVTGCGSLDAATARTIASANVDAVLRAASERVDFLNASPLLARVFQVEQGRLIEQDKVSDSIDDLTSTLSDHILAEGNVAAVDGSTVEYVMRPEVTCDSLDEYLANNDNDLEFAQSQRDDCLANYTDHPLRARATRVGCDAGDSLKLELFSGEATQPMVTFLMAPDSLQVDVEVAEAAAYEVACDDSEDQPVTLTGASGEVRTKLSLIGTTGLEGQVSIPSELVLAFTDGGQDYRDGAGEAPAVLSATVDGGTGKLEGRAAAVDLLLSQSFSSWIRSYFGTEVLTESTRTVQWEFAALTGTLRFDGTTDRVTGEGLSLGDVPMTMTSESATLVSVDVAPKTEHQVDFEAGLGADGELQVTLAKGFGLKLTYALAPVAAEVQALPSFASDDQVGIELAEATVATLPRDADGNLALDTLPTGPVLRVDSGSLTMTSTHYPQADLEVASGQCLRQLDSTPNQHEMFGDMAAGVCQ